ncbi:MAG: hypothetical protein GF331_07965 [Chitinivibrionales bacterium]|nr:hypothetical protein [Chitinivibrionales bacterium]
MCVDTYYFTGTGNSLHGARAMAGRMPSYTTENERYHHPSIGAQDISEQR